MVCTVSVLSSTMSALPGGFGHSLPCRILKIPGASKVRWTRSFVFRLGKTERSLSSYLEDPLLVLRFVGLLHDDVILPQLVRTVLCRSRSGLPVSQRPNLSLRYRTLLPLTCGLLRTWYAVDLSWSQRPNLSLRSRTLLPCTSGLSRNWYGVDLSWSQRPNFSLRSRTLLPRTRGLCRTWYGVNLSWSQRPNLTLRSRTLLPRTSGLCRTWYGVD